MTEDLHESPDPSATRFFYSLTPDRILDAVEDAGFRCTGRCMALNSMENRVYDVEIELDEPPAIPSDRFRVVKFYRPGRWSVEQIEEEHEFLTDLAEHEIPVVAPLRFDDGATLRTLDDIGISFAVFPRVGGRIADELGAEQVAQLGRLIARVHNVGAVRRAPHRLTLDAETYGHRNLSYLLESDALPASVRDRYRVVVDTICEIAGPWIAGAGRQRIHGDCHLGNVIWRGESAFLVDFDDMLEGPCVQDVWLLAPEPGEHGRIRRSELIEGYSELRDFDDATLRLVEPLRALRMLHFSAWIARRWDDPAFPRVFPDFGTERYWFEQVTALQEQLALIQESAWG